MHNATSLRNSRNTTAHSWIDRFLPRLNILWHGKSHAGWIEPLRRIYDHELVMVTDGECIIEIKGKPMRLAKGAYVVIPPDTLHTTRCLSKTGVYRHCFHFDWVDTGKPRSPGHCVFHPGLIPNALVRKAPGWIPSGPMQGQVRTSNDVEYILDRIYSRWTSKDPAQRASSRALLMELLILILTPPRESYPKEDKTKALARRVRELLGAPISQKDSVRTRLETMGYSYAHLERVFRSVYGITPLEYVNATRIEKAKMLLANRKDRIKEVAVLAGFNNPRYFSKVFRRSVGMTPGEFRE